MDSLTSGVLFEDEHRRVAFCNEGFCKMFSIPVHPSVLIGMDCNDAAIAAKPLFADPDGFITRIDEIITAKKPVVGEELKLATGQILIRDFSPIEVKTEMRGYLWHYRSKE
jgi:sensor histidine kinase regulating citrate/malate metabolism